MAGERISVRLDPELRRQLEKEALLVGARGLLVLVSLLAAEGCRTPGAPAPDEVEIVRDRWGIAHVYAAGDEAVFYGAGYATAEDRLLQMMLRRRTVQGRIAEILGRGPEDRFLGSDRRFRILGLARRAAERLASLSPESRRA